MIFSWLDESGTENLYQEKDGQTPVFVLCSWFLDSKHIVEVSNRLAELDRAFKKDTNTRGEIKGIDLVRPYKSEQNTPKYIKEANKLLLNGIIKCLADHEAKVVSRPFAKRLHAKYDTSKLYFFAHLVLFEQIYLLRNDLKNKTGDANYAELPISVVADTLPTKKVLSSRQAITNAVKEIERQSKNKFPLLWSFDLSSENAFIRVADILGRILFAVAHNRWSNELAVKSFIRISIFCGMLLIR